MKLRILFLPLFIGLFNGSFSQNQPAQQKNQDNEVIVIESDDTIAGEFGDPACTEATPKKNIDEISPFREAERIEISTFDPGPDESNMSVIDNGKFILRTEQTITLNEDQKQELFDLLFNKVKKRKGNVIASANCYYPHHVVVFYIGDVAIDFFEICFECRNYETFSETELDFCTEKWCMLYDYFLDAGLEKRPKRIEFFCHQKNKQ